MSLLALSHTPIEHRLYEVMFAQTVAAQTRVGTFNIRRLMELTGLNSYSTVRRGRAGLLSKLSIDCQKVVGAEDSPHLDTVYLIFSPEEVFARRRAAGLLPYPQEFRGYGEQRGFVAAIERVANQHNVSRREAQVALCCAEGLTNAEIGVKLSITEQTVKFHLRHVFIKFGVRRRAELVSRLLCGGESERREETVREALI